MASSWIETICRRLEQHQQAYWSGTDILQADLKLDVLRDQNILGTPVMSQVIVCTECGEQAPVVPWGGRLASFYGNCSTCGLWPVSSKELLLYPIQPLQTWRLWQELEWCSHQAAEILPQQLWRVGPARLRGDLWMVYLAIGLQRELTMQAVQAVIPPRQALILYPWRSPALQPTDSRMVFAKLADCLRCSNQEITVDRTTLEQQLPIVRAHSAKIKSPPKRSSRLVAIAALTTELTQHLQAARDYYRQQAESSREYAPYPRPTQQLLARQCQLDKTVVSRCLADPAAHELRFLWELADDPERLQAQATR